MPPRRPGPGAAAPVTTAGAAPPHRPLVIAHRGASGHRPENTLAAFELAARTGADYLEPDLVITRDGVLVARHEPEIGTTTDIASRPGFAARRTTRSVDGVDLTGWFVEDLTLAELKTLRAVERIPDLRPHNTVHDGRFEVPTLAEVLDLRERLSRELRRDIGVCPETKHPTYFADRGHPLEPALVRALRDARLDRADSPVFVQSFETTNLRALRRELDVPLVALVGATGSPFDLVAAGDPRTYRDLVTPGGLAELATFAAGVAPDKDLVIPRDAAGALGPPSTLVRDAHRAGLLVHPYTFRDENRFLPAELRRGPAPADPGDAAAEYAAFYATGVDGVFSDHPGTALATRPAR